MTFQKYGYILILIMSMSNGQTLPVDWSSYWQKSTQSILSNQKNRWILGAAALAALGATQIDMNVKNYAQTKGLLSEQVSHFGDKYGGDWGHWILWGSILSSSLISKDSQDIIQSKMQVSTFAMLTNGLITYGMKRAFGRVRPNGGCCKSFPSGHTSHSFTIAAIARDLYGNEIGALTYGVATLVAVSRINDNKHYLSDVIFGAALGTAIGRAFVLNYKDFRSNTNERVIPLFKFNYTWKF